MNICWNSPIVIIDDSTAVKIYANGMQQKASLKTGRILSL